jgi:CMP-N,N'-diacetyllegionaminic acid synthase
MGWGKRDRIRDYGSFRGETVTNIEKPILAIVPARCGSKGIPKKNIKPLCGVPLLAYGIMSARKSGIFDEVYLSSDCEEFLSLGARYGAKTVLRPVEIATDSSSAEDAMFHALHHYEEKHGILPYAIALIQCTCPFRKASHIRETYNTWLKSGADSVMSVSETPSHFHPSWQKIIDNGLLYSFDTIPPDRFLPINEISKYKVRQELPGNYYWKNGAVYIVKSKALIETGSRFGRSCAAYIIKDLLVNIDSLDDFEFAEYLLKQGKVVLDFDFNPK